MIFNGIFGSLTFGRILSLTNFLNIRLGFFIIKKISKFLYMTLNLHIKKTSKIFENPCVYALSSPHTNLLYIGSTCMPLHLRLRNHQLLYKQYIRGSINRKCSAFKLFELGYDDVKIETIDSCEDICCKKALLKRERYWIELNDCVNVNIPSRTALESSKAHYYKNIEAKKQYYQDNKEKRLQYSKDYINANKEKYKEYMKQYRIKIKAMKEMNKIEQHVADMAR